MNEYTPAIKVVKHVADTRPTTYIENLGRSVEMAGEVSLNHFRNTLSTLSFVSDGCFSEWMKRTKGKRPYPGNQDKLRQARVRIFDLHESELDLAIVELLNEIVDLALC